MTTKTETHKPLGEAAAPSNKRAINGVARKPKAAAEPPPATPTIGPRGKIGLVVDLLRRPEGATIPDMMAATGWQAHSVRGAIAGAIKKKLGLAVISTKTEKGRVYRIEAADDAG